MGKKNKSLNQESTRSVTFYEDQIKQITELQKLTNRSRSFVIRQMVNYCLNNEPLEIIQSLGDVNE